MTTRYSVLMGLICFATLSSSASAADVVCSLPLESTSISSEEWRRIQKVDSTIKNTEMNLSEAEFKELEQTLDAKALSELQAAYQNPAVVVDIHEATANHVRMALSSRSSPGNIVDGDFYKVMMSGDRSSVLVFLGDAESHGLVAAAGSVKMQQFMASSTHVQALTAPLFSSAERLRYLDRSTTFVTPSFAMAHVSLNVKTGVLDYASTSDRSIPNIFVISEDRNVTRIRTNGKKIGLHEDGDAAFEGVRVSLRPKDTVVMMTDGFYDTLSNFYKNVRHHRRDAGAVEHFGLSSWEETLKEVFYGELSTEQAKNRLERLFEYMSADDFHDGAIVGDDASVLVFQWRP